MHRVQRCILFLHFTPTICTGNKFGVWYWLTLLIDLWIVSSRNWLNRLYVHWFHWSMWSRLSFWLIWSLHVKKGQNCLIQMSKLPLTTVVCRTVTLYMKKKLSNCRGTIESCELLFLFCDCICCDSQTSRCQGPNLQNIGAAVRLKFLIAINLAIKKLIFVNLTINRKVKTRQYVLIIIQSTVHFTQKSQPNTRKQSQMLALRLLSLQAQPVI